MIESIYCCSETDDYDIFEEEALSLSDTADRLEGATYKAIDLINAQQRLIELLLQLDRRQDDGVVYLNKYIQFKRDRQDLQDSLACIQRLPPGRRLNIFASETSELDALRAELDDVYRILGKDRRVDTLELPSLKVDVYCDDDVIPYLPSGSRTIGWTDDVVQRLRALEREKEALLAAVSDKESYILNFRRDYAHKYGERLTEQRELVELLRNTLSALEGRKSPVPRMDSSNIIMQGVPYLPRLHEEQSLYSPRRNEEQSLYSPRRYEEQSLYSPRRYEEQSLYSPRRYEEKMSYSPRRYEEQSLLDIDVSRLLDEVKNRGEDTIDLLNEYNHALVTSTDPRRSNEEKRQTFRDFEDKLMELRQKLRKMKERLINESVGRPSDANYLLEAHLDMKKQRYIFMNDHLTKQFERVKKFIDDELNSASDDKIHRKLDDEITFIKTILQYADFPSGEERKKIPFLRENTRRSGVEEGLGSRQRRSDFEVPTEEIERAETSYDARRPSSRSFQGQQPEASTEDAGRNQQKLEDEQWKAEDYERDEDIYIKEDEEDTEIDYPNEYELNREILADPEINSDSTYSPVVTDETAQEQKTYEEDVPEVETRDRQYETEEKRGYEVEDYDAAETSLPIVQEADESRNERDEPRRVVSDERTYEKKVPEIDERDYQRDRERNVEDLGYEEARPNVPRRPVANVRRGTRIITTQSRPVTNVQRGARTNVRRRVGKTNVRRRFFDPKLPLDDDVMEFDQPLTKY